MTIRSNTRIRKGGVLVGSADELDLIEGANTTITASTVAPRSVEVTIASTGGGGGGAPTDADYLVGTANGDLSGEIVVGTTPGGELGNTWASPTVDPTHSGSTHAATQAAAEATAATALSGHATDTTAIHGIADTAVLETTTGSQTKVDTHSADTTSVHGITDTAAIPPNTADYLVGTANAGLTAEIVVGTSPGGELGGTWASPTVDATHSGSTHSAAADTHIADTSDAHDASAISIADAGGDFTATDVEGALDELQADNEAHLADTSDAHDASAISFSPTGSIAATDVQAAIAEVASEAGGGGEAFPVGSVFISVVSTNPGTLLGYGTWSAFATGRTIVGIDAGQTEFDTVEETGGAKTHTLTEAEIASHQHTVSSDDTAGSNAITLKAGAATPERDAPSAASGGGGAHNNLQPYIVVYMWKRTA